MRRLTQTSQKQVTIICDKEKQDKQVEECQRREIERVIRGVRSWAHIHLYRVIVFQQNSNLSHRLVEVARWWCFEEKQGERAKRET